MAVMTPMTRRARGRSNRADAMQPPGGIAHRFSMIKLTMPVLLAIALLGIAGTVSYLNWVRTGRRKSVAGLECLRFLLIALLAFTLLRPEVVRTIKSKDQPELVVLVDRSGSMGTQTRSDGTEVRLPHGQDLSFLSWLWARQTVSANNIAPEGGWIPPWRYDIGARPAG